MRFLCITFLCLGLLLPVKAQQTEVFLSDIYTIQAIANQSVFSPPIIYLDSKEQIEISFDRFSHEYRRYQYRISHHNADWSPSELFETDYLDGFNNLPVEDYATSINTTVPYTHYSFYIPNDKVTLTQSGNYSVTVYDEDKNNMPVFKTCFRVVDKSVDITASVTTNTDIDRNKSHQQVNFSVNYSGYDIRNPHNEIKVQVLQNGRTDNLASNLFPTYLTASELKYEHKKELIFTAGNEYRRFETTNIRNASSTVEEIQFYDPYYHVTLYPDNPRTGNYIYDKDQNGKYIIRYDRATDNSIEADYFLVHFSLPWDKPLTDGNFFIQGAFTYNSFNSQSMLQYNEKSNAYESVLLLKQGAYNYQYVFVPNGQQIGYSDLVEGNHYQTKNEYVILVYHRPFGERYDKLIGYSMIDFKP